MSGCERTNVNGLILDLFLNKLRCKYICVHQDTEPTYFDIADNGGTNKVAILVALDVDVSAIQ